ncbi:MAG TPA: hypothetical protein VGQ87_03285 [Patescibacteria group bacterium]|jgi:hypothetical protein|nr:hypothetical protein [Patescibacteria group bacterium]
MLTAYQPTNFWHTILALAFYLLMAGYVVYSFFAIYALIRFGRSKFVATAVAMVYVVISVSLYVAASSNLNKITF